jgi:hypothetical protein
VEAAVDLFSAFVSFWYSGNLGGRLTRDLGCLKDFLSSTRMASNRLPHCVVMLDELEPAEVSSLFAGKAHFPTYRNLASAHRPFAVKLVSPLSIHRGLSHPELAVLTSSCVHTLPALSPAHHPHFYCSPSTPETSTRSCPYLSDRSWDHWPYLLSSTTVQSIGSYVAPGASIRAAGRRAHA